MRVTVVGLGTIGHSLAQMFAMGGCAVRCYDPAPAARSSCRSRISANLDGMMTAELMTSGEAESALARVAVFDSLVSAVRGAALVCEAVLEELALKQALFAEIESLAEPSALLTSTSSSFPIDAIAARMSSTSRCLVLHP
jgi:3-hydroxybutyryl-CoA dehydrogenase